jgi:hypothetical protein
MTVSREEAKEALDRLNALADRTVESETIGEFDGQDINDVRTITQRLEMLEGLHSYGSLTIGGGMNIPPGEYTIMPVVK